MYIVLLKFSDNQSQAARFMDGHSHWLQRGFDEGVFLLAGSLRPNLGGVILANNIEWSALQDWVRDDPFVAERVVSAEILEVAPGRADARLSFLLG